MPWGGLSPPIKTSLNSLLYADAAHLNRSQSFRGHCLTLQPVVWRFPEAVLVSFTCVD